MKLLNQYTKIGLDKVNKIKVVNAIQPANKTGDANDWMREYLRDPMNLWHMVVT